MLVFVLLHVGTGGFGNLLVLVRRLLVWVLYCGAIWTWLA